MVSAIDTAFNTPEIKIRSSKAAYPTGNCTWPPYSTVVVCHQCKDVSYLLQYICKNHTTLNIPGMPDGAADPCGFKVNDTLIVVDTFDSPHQFGPFLNTTIFANATLPIADFYVGYTPGGPSAVMRNQTPVLVECLFTWCAKTIQAQSDNVVLQ
ncbi:hypothetical protein EJ02DRAFT_35144 [Clathrospora elynae]|uniref:Uncharacterized protein n=1 Tax=Clathrospora elynae TaxID=706981 RepID=A0A6A5T0X5_9PLEO|nr:hypothetical protein EJ02DRAFT_35144 [Clathrospora elynae]